MGRCDCVGCGRGHRKQTREDLGALRRGGPMTAGASVHDRLLRFLSERGSGDWAELRNTYNWLALDERRAVEDPADKAWIAARDLAALGHIEVEWDEQLSWAAAPPLVTM